MTDDRYQPPGAEIQDELMNQALRGSGSFDIGTCVSDGWDNTWSSFPLWLGFGLVFLLLSFLSIITVDEC